MMDKRTFILTHPAARNLAAKFALEGAPDGYVVEFKEPTRSSEQNAKLHAAISDIAQQIEWAGQRLDVEDWKRLLTAAWLRAEKQQIRMIPALDGQGFDVLYRRTSRMSKSEMVSLIEYVMAWGTDQGVRWSDIEYRVAA